MTGEHRSDVVIVGAGFAGASAATVLVKAGLKVVILEARDRVGGRAFTRRFMPSGEVMEFGGSWIAPAHFRIRRHCACQGIVLRPTPLVKSRRWHDGTGLHSDGPARARERSGYDAAMAKVRSDALAHAACGGRPERSTLHISLNEYLRRSEANRAACAQILAWWCISGNGDPETISAAEFISSCAHGDGSPESMMSALTHSLDPGASELVARMIVSSGAELCLSSPITAVRQVNGEVTAETANGEVHRAGALILAIPLNVLRALRFSPHPGRRKLEAMAIGHGGCSFKVWIKARGAGCEVGTLVTGGLSGMQWMFAERETSDGAVMIVGFGLPGAGLDPSSRSAVQSSLRRFFPGAALIGYDWHDWVGDSWARGTWLATPAAAPWIAEAEEWQKEGNVFFASADFASGTPGWFESAIASGEMAAENVLGCLS